MEARVRVKARARLKVRATLEVRARLEVRAHPRRSGVGVGFRVRVGVRD